MILQLGWFVDFEPPWLPPALLVIGSIVLVYGLLNIDDRYQDSSVIRRTMIAAGIGLVYLPFHLRFPLISVVFLSIAGKYLEGVAVVRAYQKIHFIVRKRSLPGNISPKTRAFFVLSGLFVSLVGGWVFIGVAFSGDPSSLAIATLIIWTVITALAALLGMSATLWGVKQKTPTAIIVGFSLMVAGAEIHNLAMLSQEITLFFANTIFFGFGFIVAAILVLKHGQEIAELSNRLAE